MGKPFPFTLEQTTRRAEKVLGVNALVHFPGSWIVSLCLSVRPSINTRQFCIFKLKLCNYLVPSGKFTREDKEILVKINLACSDNCCPALKNRN